MRRNSPLSGRSPRLRILAIASEMTPWVKTGGLADVAGALPAALEALGHDITTVIPRYRHVLPEATATHRVTVTQGSLVRPVDCLVREESPSRRTVFVEAPAAFDRPGIYAEAGVDYHDNWQRFDLLGQAALEYALAVTGERSWDVVHLHDWQTGTAGLRLLLEDRWGDLRRAGIVFTVHNLAYQGTFSKDVVPSLGLPWSAFRMELGEFWGQFSFLKSGIASADLVTTVSPTYAEETRTPASGAGLDGLLRSLGDRYVGILNGIDTSVWDPASDSYLPAHFSADDLSGKRECKRVLLSEFGLPQGDDALARPVIGLVSRLVAQKGLDLIERAMPDMIQLDATWVFLGSGEARYEGFLRHLQSSYPGRVGVRIGFDERLAHLIEAGSDLFMMPSEFEPCGLNQMYSLRYGTVPIVRAVGGLHDTIQPYTARALHANGFKFRDARPEVLAHVTRRAVRLYRHPEVWRRLMRNGMAADHSWSTPAREYVKVYRRARADGGVRARLISAKG